MEAGRTPSAVPPQTVVNIVIRKVTVERDPNPTTAVGDVHATRVAIVACLRTAAQVVGMDVGTVLTCRGRAKCHCAAHAGSLEQGANGRSHPIDSGRRSH
ncbi:MAG: hypothetical protein GY943_37275 [Chloroflexi bacterium]|nr:hypothetical protein [Chloroflexota bacterium]